MTPITMRANKKLKTSRLEMTILVHPAPKVISSLRALAV